MPGYTPLAGEVGHGPVNDLVTVSTTQLFPLGMMVDAFDEYFGWGRFIYLKSAAAQVVGTQVYWDNAFTATALPNTANQGFPFAVARQPMTAADQFGWYQVEGNCPLKVTASVATGVAIGITGAGTAGANSASKQLLGVRVHQASTFALTKAGSRTQNGSKVIKVPSVSGLFIGLALSGTGVAAGTIASIDAGANEITSTANSTATGTITLTATYTGFVLAGINNPFAQGAIT